MSRLPLVLLELAANSIDDEGSMNTVGMLRKLIGGIATLVKLLTVKDLVRVWTTLVSIFLVMLLVADFFQSGATLGDLVYVKCWLLLEFNTSGFFSVFTCNDCFNMLFFLYP